MRLVGELVQRQACASDEMRPAEIVEEERQLNDRLGRVAQYLLVLVIARALASPFDQHFVQPLQHVDLGLEFLLVQVPSSYGDDCCLMVDVVAGRTFGREVSLNCGYLPKWTTVAVLVFGLELDVVALW